VDHVDHPKAATAGSRLRRVSGVYWQKNGTGWLTVEENGVLWCHLELPMLSEGFKGREWLMFLGTHSPRLDDKGRLVLPAKFRDGLASGLVFTKGQERSIVVWPTAEFTEYAERLNVASRSDAAVRAYLRVLFSGATDEIPDRQGRVMVPAALREYAGLEREVVVVGNGSTLEIWNASAWQQYLAGQEDNFSDLSEEVIPGIL